MIRAWKKHDRTNLTRSQEGHNRPVDPSRMHIQAADSVFVCLCVCPTIFSIPHYSALRVSQPKQVLKLKPKELQMLADVGSVGQASTIETHQMPTAFPGRIVPEAVYSWENQRTQWVTFHRLITRGLVTWLKHIETMAFPPPRLVSINSGMLSTGRSF